MKGFSQTRVKYRGMEWEGADLSQTPGFLLIQADEAFSDRPLILSYLVLYETEWLN